MTNTKSDNALIMFFNGAAVLVAYGMLGLSLYLSTEVPLSTKCFWGIGILLLTLALVNFVKYRFHDRLSEDRIQRLGRRPQREAFVRLRQRQRLICNKQMVGWVKTHPTHFHIFIPLLRFVS
jgi:hypothetical protein